MTIDFADSPHLLFNKSVATSFVSDVVSINILNTTSFKFNWTGVFTGQIKITFSNTNEIINASNPPADIIWNNLMLLTITAGLSPDSDTFWLAEAFTGVKYLRVEYTAVSGTGTMNCQLHSKSFG